MKRASPKVGSLHLAVIAGPEVSIPALRAEDGGRVIGRSSTCEIVLADEQETVSRRHARLSCEGGEWWVSDLSSRRGTFVNGLRLAPNVPARLHDKDRVRIGPWTLEARLEGETTQMSPGSRSILGTIADREETRSQIRRLGGAISDESQRRLALLMDAATRIGGARSEAEVARAAVDALVAGTGLARAAVVRPAGRGGTVEVLAQGDHQPTISESLLDAAGAGEVVALDVAAPLTPGVTAMRRDVVALGLAAALCAPVMMDDRAEAFLYAEASSEGSVGAAELTPEVVAYAQALARLCALALADHQRRRLQRDEEERMAELSAARAVQRLIMPPARGGNAGVRYAMHATPGRQVAGDLFDFIPMSRGRAAALLGDVSGKGVAAGMVMSHVQAHLARLLQADAPLLDVLAEANGVVRRLGERVEDGGPALFVTLWLGVFDPASRSIEVSDVGHGYFVVRERGEVRRVTMAGSTPLGIAPEGTLQTETMELAPGAALVAFSDGLHDQVGIGGERFGMGGVERALAGSTKPEHDVERLREAVAAHAGANAAYGDDVTIASIEFA